MEALAERMAAARPLRVHRAVDVTPGWYGWNNDYTMDCLRGNEDWLAVCVLCDPIGEEGAGELVRLVGEGASAVRIQPPVTGPLTDPRQTPIWSAAASLGITVQVNLPERFDAASLPKTHGQFALDLPGHAQVAQRAREHPDTPIVLDHCGWLSGGNPNPPSVAPLLELARIPNVYPKLSFYSALGSAPFREAQPLMRQLVDAFGAERCVGLACTTAGVTDQATYDAAVRLFAQDFPCTEAERGWLLGGTALKLWRWKNRGAAQTNRL